MAFPHSIPYADPKYFLLLLIAFIPLILSMLIAGKRPAWYQSLVTLFFLYVSFGGASWHQGVALILYVLWQTLLVYAYFSYRQQKNSSSIFYGAVVLAILPLAIT
ncbi:MAG: D-alanyl-lipoteichoic acid biosynthesis protein DltB, partial [Enterococcus sp.]